ncbi:hypothetical protein CMI42_01335 [Candidatus Pacearchaeota archaeon]|jgi:osmotically-inducible protein OsmY|nr:hypothetical protein [Candidatus Pacearchaeota archaeon]
MTENVTSEALEQRLSESPIRDLSKVSVKVKDDTVYLTGRLKSFYLKQVAQEWVRPSSNGCPIVNSISVAKY